jgi:hypothetical protein
MSGGISSSGNASAILTLYGFHTLAKRLFDRSMAQTRATGLKRGDNELQRLQGRDQLIRESDLRREEDRLT